MIFQILLYLNKQTGPKVVIKRIQKLNYFGGYNKFKIIQDKYDIFFHSSSGWLVQNAL